MGRIRSIHPGVWSDEQFAALSIPARVLVFGLWTDADDRGVFEWKPVGLKMRIFPADSIDVAPLLNELAAANVVMRFEAEGKSYGAVRNFCRFQSPRRPTFKHPTTPEVDHFVALSNSIPDNGGNETPIGEGEGEGEGKGKVEVTKKTAPAGRRPKVYIFENGVIKLEQVAFDRWRKAYSNLSLEAELEALAEWAAKQGDRWFPAVSAVLAKKNQAIADRREVMKHPPKVFWRSGIEGVT